LSQLRRAPGFTVTAVVTLALGIGANSTILSWISSTLFDPIPGVTQTKTWSPSSAEIGVTIQPPLSYPDFADLRDHAKSFSGIVGYHDDFMSSPEPPSRNASMGPSPQPTILRFWACGLSSAVPRRFAGQ